MPTLNQILDSGLALVFLGADSDIEKELPTGMVIGCSRKFYKVYFQVNGEDDFEYVNSYPVPDWTNGKDIVDILTGAYKLAEGINENKVSL